MTSLPHQCLQQRVLCKAQFLSRNSTVTQVRCFCKKASLALILLQSIPVKANRNPQLTRKKKKKIHSATFCYLCSATSISKKAEYEISLLVTHSSIRLKRYNVLLESQLTGCQPYICQSKQSSALNFRAVTQLCYYLKDYLYSNNEGHLLSCYCADIIVPTTGIFPHTHMYLNTHIHCSILTALMVCSLLGLQGSVLVFTEV